MLRRSKKQDLQLYDGETSCEAGRMPEINKNSLAKFLKHLRNSFLNIILENY